MSALYANQDVTSALADFAASFLIVCAIALPILALIYGLMALQIYLLTKNNRVADIEISIADEMRVLNGVRLTAGLEPIIFDEQQDAADDNALPSRVRHFLDMMTEPLPERYY